MPVVERPLDTNEDIFHVFDKQHGACRTAQLVKVRGRFGGEVLREAMRRLVKRHARLGTKPVDGPSGPVWQLDTREPLLKILAAEKARELESVLSGALHGTTTDPVWWVEWIAGGDEQVLCLVLHHSAADGVSAATLAIDLVGLIDDVLDDRPVESALYEPPPLDDVLAHIGLIDDLSYRLGRLRYRFFGKPGPLPRFEARAGAEERRTRLLIDDIPSATISAVHARAKREGATVGGAITAAVVRAVTSVDEIDGPIDVATQVSLRPRCEPTLRPTAVGCYGGRALTQHRGATDFWRLAKECSSAVRRSLDSGESEIPLFRTRGKTHYVRDALANLIDNPESQGRTCTLAISNLGVLHPAEARAVRLSGFYPAIANHPAGSLYQLSCGTLNGDLQCVWMYVTPLVSETRARNVWRAARNQLTGAVA